MTVPHFLCIGAQRAGTTWLYDALAGSPDLWLPPIKELHYFDSIDPNLGLSSVRYSRHFRERLKHNIAALVGYNIFKQRGRPPVHFDPTFDLRYFFGVRNIDWYKDLFKKAAKRGKITGEITPSYAILSRDIIRQVYEANPKMKIILILRDPIDRIWSAAVRLLCRETARSVEEVSDNEFFYEFNQPRARMRSDYVAILDNWSAVFPLEQIFVGFFEEITSDPVALCSRIVAFLKVEDNSFAATISFNAKNVASKSRGAIPLRFAQVLAEGNLGMLRELARRYPQPCASWLGRAESLLSGYEPSAESAKE